MHELKVLFQPSGRRVFVLPGTLLLEAAERAGVILQTPCGGKGTCGKCRVLIDGKDVLACCFKVEEDLVVDVPDAALFVGGQQILVTDAGRAAGVLDPPVRVVPFTLSAPTQQDDVSDYTRLQAAVGGGLRCRLGVLRQIPQALRAGGWCGVAVTTDTHILGLLPAGSGLSVFGVAFDVGTTTVVGTLIDLVTGAERCLASRMNGQISLGDDVIARIQRVREEPGALAKLQGLIVGTLQDIIDDLVAQAGIARTDIYEVALAGNATMQQLLLGLDCSALGEVPFVQVLSDAVTYPADIVGLQVNRGAELYVFPQIGGFVGGDTVAGIVATQLDQQAGAMLLVDIGTNGEIVLAHNGRMYATSTAAGPAFEGALITHGMRAAAGAIERIIIKDDVHY
ncbi:MAG: ASKHA domain-containing protein, partial [Kiritimatiellia bacterium]